MDPVGVGIVGYGYWGPKLVRNFSTAKTTRAIAVCDLDEGRLEQARSSHNHLETFRTLEEMLDHPEIEAVAVATPVNTHHRLVKTALEANKHVLVEKPFTRTSEQASELIALAKERECILMVDHTFVFTSAVRKLREIVQSGELGELLYYDSIRINLGLIQPDVDVIWDLAPHDFSILDFVLERGPKRIAAFGASHTPMGTRDVAYVTLDFGNNFLAHFHLNWLAPTKVRNILVGGMNKMVEYNDVEPDTKIRIFNRGIELPEWDSPATITADDALGRYQSMIAYRTGDVHAPWLSATEALLNECTLFGRACRTGESIPNDGQAGLRIVKMLEATSTSLENEGRFVDVDFDNESS